MHPIAAHIPKPRPEIEVAAGLVFRQGKLLITQRRPEADQGGLWEFPGGKREKNESFEACLARELREELGIEVGVGELVESLTHAYPEKTVSLRFYLCRWLDHEPKPIACADLKWVTPETLADYAFPAADARLLDKLARMFRAWAA
ncbi:MAG: 8-oxo-dGTP diphosphatase MutT [Limisphaerales bacterium]